VGNPLSKREVERFEPVKMINTLFIHFHHTWLCIYTQKNKNKNKILVQHYTTNHHVATICWQPFQTGKAVYYSSHKAEKTSGSGCFPKSSST